MISNNNNVELGKKHYPETECNHDITDDVVTKRQCRQCYKTIVAGYNLTRDRFTTYEIDKYPDQLIQHEHPVDNVTRIDLQHRIPIEIRQICRPNKEDFRRLNEKPKWMMNYK